MVSRTIMATLRWQCPVCRHQENHDSLLDCSHCGIRRIEVQPNNWCCQKCTYAENPKGAMRCLCGTAKSSFGVANQDHLQNEDDTVTSYNYEREDGSVDVLQLSPIGLECGGCFWSWDCIWGCKVDSERLILIVTTNVSSSLLNAFNMLQEDVVEQVGEDVKRRLQVFQQDSVNASTSSRDSEELEIHRALNMSVADHHGFLGVSVYHLLTEFLPQVEKETNLFGSSKFCEIENLEEPSGFVRHRSRSTTCPIDGKKGAAYVHCLEGQDHVGRATHMLSWTWSYTVREVVSTLVAYCDNEECDPKRTYVWICCLCLNQHRIAQSNSRSGMGDTCSALDLESEFKRRVLGIGHVLVMMRPWGDPANLKRIWCIFECFYALTNNCDVSFIMPPYERDRMAMELFSPSGETNKHVIDTLYRALNNIDSEKAEATAPQDRIRILELIREGIGFEKVNFLVRDRLRFWVREVIDSLVAERKNHEKKDDNMNAGKLPYLTDAGKLSYCIFLKQVGDVYVSDLYGDYPEALEVYSECLAMRQSIQGDNHLDVAKAHTDMGGALFSQGQLGASLEHFICALRIREKLLDKGHLDTAHTYFYIGRLLLETHDYDEAMLMMQKCLTIQDENRSNRDAAVTRSYIALLMSKDPLGSRDLVGSRNPLEMAKTSLETLLCTVGREHPDTAFCYDVLSQLCQGDLARSLWFIEQCISIQKSVLGHQHPSLVATYSRHGEILCWLGRTAQAMEVLNEACGIYHINSGCKHVPISRTYARQSVVALCLQNEQDSNDCHQRCMVALNTLGQPMDDELLLIYSSGGEKLLGRNDEDSATVLFRRGLEAMEAMLGKNHPHVVAANGALAKGDFEEYRQCLFLAKLQERGQESPHLVELRRYLAGPA